MEVPAPGGVELVRVETALELREAVHKAAADSDVVVMAAAVADFRPDKVVETKIKKSDDTADPVITLVRNPDILQEIVQARGTGATPALIVGFAAETGDATTDVLEYGRRKLARKGCDLLVLNQVGKSLVFGQDQTEVRILSPAEPAGSAGESAAGSKTEVSARIIARIAAELAARRP